MCQLKFTSSNLYAESKNVNIFHVCFLTLLECLSSYCWKTLEHIEGYKKASVMSRASDSDNPECRYNKEIPEFALGIWRKWGLEKTQAEQKIKEDWAGIKKKQGQREIRLQIQMDSGRSPLCHCSIKQWFEKHIMPLLTKKKRSCFRNRSENDSSYSKHTKFSSSHSHHCCTSMQACLHPGNLYPGLSEMGN